MKILLVEDFSEEFDFSEELEYYADDVVDDEDSGKVSGLVYVQIDSDEVLTFFWEHADIDIDKHPELEDYLNWKKYVKENYEELWENLGEALQDYYKDRARDKVYDNWDNYVIEDESPYDDRAELLRDYYRNVL